MPPTRRGGTTEWMARLGRARDRSCRQRASAAPWRGPKHRRRQGVRVIFPDVERRFLELVGEQAEARNVRRSSPSPKGLKSTKVTLIASPGSAPSITIGPSGRVDLGEVEIAGCPATVHCGVIWPAEESLHFSSSVSPGADGQDRLQRVVPAEVMLVVMDGVARGHDGCVPELNESGGRSDLPAAVCEAYCASVA